MNDRCTGCFSSAHYHLILDEGKCIDCLAHDALIQAETDALEASLAHDKERYDDACERMREAERQEAMQRHPSYQSRRNGK